jgi:hypothetical protein
VCQLLDFNVTGSARRALEAVEATREGVNVSGGPALVEAPKEAGERGNALGQL